VLAVCSPPSVLREFRLCGLEARDFRSAGDACVACMINATLGVSGYRDRAATILRADLRSEEFAQRTDSFLRRALRTVLALAAKSRSNPDPARSYQAHHPPSFWTSFCVVCLPLILSGDDFLPPSEFEAGLQPRSARIFGFDACHLTLPGKAHDAAGYKACSFAPTSELYHPHLQPLSGRNSYSMNPPGPFCLAPPLHRTLGLYRRDITMWPHS
jgi:hypothetical protein